MKRTFIIITLVLLNLNVFAQNKPTYYYYDKNWKGVSSIEFATYYRIMSISKEFGNKTRLFDINGTLLSESGFIKIDKLDDHKTILDGDFESYYTNGRTHVKCKYSNGIYAGKYQKFFDNGQLAIETFYVNGVQDGLRREFTKDGKLFSTTSFVSGLKTRETLDNQLENGLPIVVEYNVPQPNYATFSVGANKYVVSDKGVTSQRQPRPSDFCYIADKKLETYEETYNINGVKVSLKFFTTRDYGKYERFLIHIENYTTNKIHISPSDFKYSIIYADGKSSATPEVLTADAYGKKIKTRHIFKELTLGILLGVGSGSINYGTTNAKITTNYQDGRGNTYATRTADVEIYDPELAQLQMTSNSQAIANTIDNMVDSDNNSYQEHMEDYFVDTDIEPFSAIDCYLNAKSTKYALYHLVTFKINGVEYKFCWKEVDKHMAVYSPFQFKTVSSQPINNAPQSTSTTPSNNTSTTATSQQSSNNTTQPTNSKNTIFADKTLEKIIFSQCDKNKDGKISKEEILATTKITATNCGITSLKGIEFFPNLEILYVNNNKFSIADLHKNKRLRDIKMESDMLKTVYISSECHANFDISKEKIRVIGENNTTMTQNQAEVSEEKWKEVKFVDETFKKIILTQCDKDGNGKISESEAKAVTKILATHCGIKSLQGIEMFPNLEILYASKNLFVVVDLRKNKKLKEIQLNSEYLKSVYKSKLCTPLIDFDKSILKEE